MAAVWLGPAFFWPLRLCCVHHTAVHVANRAGRICRYILLLCLSFRCKALMMKTCMINNLIMYLLSPLSTIGIVSSRFPSICQKDKRISPHHEAERKDPSRNLFRIIPLSLNAETLLSHPASSYLLCFALSHSVVYHLLAHFTQRIYALRYIHNRVHSINPLWVQ